MLSPAAKALEAPLVDCHFHIYEPGMPVLGSAWHKHIVDASAERCLQTFDANGVLFGVIAAASLFGDYNDYVREALLKHKRLRSTAIVRPTISRRELEAMNDDGFVGIRLQWRNVTDPPDLTGDDYRILLRRIADLGWHVHLNDLGPRLAPTIEILENAGVKLVLDHFGRPDPATGIACPGFQAVLRSLEKGKCWVKLSAGFRLADESAAKTYSDELIRVSGGERLVWGSDWPFAGHESRMTYESTVKMLEEWVPDPAMRRRIGGVNALELYFAP